jgi:hypothetical protein
MEIQNQKPISKLPNRKLTFKVEENEYTVDYPNTGQYIEMIRLRHALALNNYTVLVSGQTEADQRARYIIETIAFCMVCCTKLKEDLKVQSISELDMITSKKLLKVYMTAILPWLTEWETILSSDEDVKVEEGKK